MNRLSDSQNGIAAAMVSAILLTTGLLTTGTSAAASQETEPQP